MNRLYNKVEVDTILSDQIASFQLLPWTDAHLHLHLHIIFI